MRCVSVDGDSSQCGRMRRYLVRVILCDACQGNEEPKTRVKEEERKLWCLMWVGIVGVDSLDQSA